MREHTTRKTETQSQQTSTSSEAFVWYLDPRVWLFAIGLLCWIAGSYLEADPNVVTKP